MRSPHPTQRLGVTAALMLACWSGAPAHAQEELCSVALPRASALAAMDKADASLQALDLRESIYLLEKLEWELRCADFLVEPSLLARFADQMAILYYFRQDYDKALRWRRMWAATETGYPLPEWVPQGPFESMLEEAETMEPQTVEGKMLAVPKGGGSFVNGKLTVSATATFGMPVYVQLADKKGVVTYSGFQDGPNFPDRVLVAASNKPLKMPKWYVPETYVPPVAVASADDDMDDMDDMDDVAPEPEPEPEPEPVAPEPEPVAVAPEPEPEPVAPEPVAVAPEPAPEPIAVAPEPPPVAPEPVAVAPEPEPAPAPEPLAPAPEPVAPAPEPVAAAPEPEPEPVAEPAPVPVLAAPAPADDDGVAMVDDGGGPASPPPLPAGCPAAVGPEQLMVRITAAYQAFGAQDARGFIEQTNGLAQDLPCVRTPIDPATIGGIHRAMGLRAYFDGDAIDSAGAFAAARYIQPDWVFPADILTARHPVRLEYEKIVPDLIPAIELPEPASGSIRFDGREGMLRPAEWPTVVQRVGADGAVHATSYLWPSDPMFAYDR